MGVRGNSSTGLPYAEAMASFMARTPAAAPSGWFQTALTTARKSAPARTSGAQFAGVIDAHTGPEDQSMRFS